MIIPWAVPPIAKISMWKAVFNPVCGYLNAYLLKLHLIDQAVNWTTDINFAKYTVITVFVWGCVPFTALSLLATLQQVPTDIHEAAVLDGANSVKYFRYIVLPYLNQTTAITMSLVVVWIILDLKTPLGELRNIFFDSGISLFVQIVQSRLLILVGLDQLFP